MQNKYNFIAVNFTLCNIQVNDFLFSDIFIILNEDFIQTLLIVLKDF